MREKIVIKRRLLNPYKRGKVKGFWNDDNIQTLSYFHGDANSTSNSEILPIMQFRISSCSRIQPRNAMIKFFKPTFYPLTCMELSFPLLREDHALRIFKNRKVQMIFGLRYSKWNLWRKITQRGASKSVHEETCVNVNQAIFYWIVLGLLNDACSTTQVM